MPVVGLIAGEGQLPILVARGMRDAGVRVACVGFSGHFDPGLPSECPIFSQVGVMQIGRWIRHLRRAGVTEAVMVGRVRKVRMHDPLRALRQLPDWRAINLWYRRLRHDHRSSVVLAAVADELTSSGIRIIDSTTYIPAHLATEGVMGRIRPSADAEADIAFGWALLERAADLDIGQALAVRDRDVIAVEAVEGTNAMIDRAGSLCRTKGWTLLKTARSGHDMRADVPTVGVPTVERLAAAGGRTLALGVQRVIMIDKPAVLAAADRLGVAVVGVRQLLTESAPTL